jgi:chloramphenicol O-acetyltransferase type A
MKEFDTSQWNRKKQFELFQTYDDPYFNLTTQLDVSNLYDFTKKNELSFFLTTLFVALETANEFLEFRLRFFKETVVEFNSVNIGSTVLNADNTFSFAYFERKKSVFEFDSSGKAVLGLEKSNLDFEENKQVFDLIHCSFIPWVNFTSFKHARKKEMDAFGIPKFVFGKYFDDNETKKMSFSIEVHHALMDGFHVGKFLEKFQNSLNAL